MFFDVDVHDCFEKDKHAVMPPKVLYLICFLEAHRMKSIMSVIFKDRSIFSLS
ncbi:hypothetical protein TNCT_333721, partial [Trichonephila clavata]